MRRSGAKTSSTESAAYGTEFSSTRNRKSRAELLERGFQGLSQARAALQIRAQPRTFAADSQTGTTHLSGRSTGVTTFLWNSGEREATGYLAKALLPKTGGTQRDCSGHVLHCSEWFRFRRPRSRASSRTCFSRIHFDLIVQCPRTLQQDRQRDWGEVRSLGDVHAPAVRCRGVVAEEESESMSRLFFEACCRAFALGLSAILLLHGEPG